MRNDRVTLLGVAASKIALEDAKMDLAAIDGGAWASLFMHSCVFVCRCICLYIYVWVRVLCQLAACLPDSHYNHADN